MALKPLKLVSYRGGIAAFEVPDSWVEEYEPKGGGTFYEPRDDSGTLRVNVLGFESETETAPRMARSALKDANAQSAQGFPLRYEVGEAREDGERLEIHRWHVAIPVLPHSIRMAIFSYTILFGQQSEPRIAEELRTVDTSIRRAIFSVEQGVAGDYEHQTDT